MMRLIQVQVYRMSPIPPRTGIRARAQLRDDGVIKIYVEQFRVRLQGRCVLWCTVAVAIRRCVARDVLDTCVRRA